MRAIFGVLGLLMVVVIVGMLAKKQLGTGVAPVVPGAAAPAGASAPPASPASPASPKQQVQQFEQAVQGAMQQARPMPDNDK